MALLSEAQTVNASAPEGYVQPTGGGDYFPPPPEITPLGGNDTAINPSVEDLYGPDAPTAEGPAATTVATPTSAGIAVNDPAVTGVDPTIVAGPAGADVTISDPSVAEVGTPGIATADPTGALSQAAGVIGEQSDLTSEQQVDAELARILGQDSPLLARARQEAVRRAGDRGLQNTSIAIGAAEGAMVDRALPMAQQNAAQGFQRELANAQLRQEAGIFTASEQNRLTALEAELGTSVSVFNADQLNQAESLAAQMRTALEQQDTDAYNRAATQFAELQRSAEAQQAGIDSQTAALEAQMRTALEQQDTEAYNRASLQLAELQRSAQAQQADIGFAAEQQRAAEQQAYNQQIIDRVSQINEQYLRGTQAMDLATIQGTYNQIISTNTTAASLYQSYFNGIAGVMDNPDMTPSQIASAVDNMQRMLEASLRMVAEMNNMDFGDIGATLPGGDTGDEGGGGGGGGSRGK